jgi:hypothetical protein
MECIHGAHAQQYKKEVAPKEALLQQKPWNYRH